MKIWKSICFIVTALALLLSACGPSSFTGTPDVTIWAGSEGQSLEPFIVNYCANNASKYGPKNDLGNYTVSVKYDGSVVQSEGISQGGVGVDIWMPPSSLWISYGDTQKLIAGEYVSTSTSFVMLWLTGSVHDQLGWGKDVYMKDVAAAQASGILRNLMTTVGMSNSGTQTMVSYIYSEAGNPVELKVEDLQSDQMKKAVSEFLSNVDTVESSGFARDKLVETWPKYNAMFNYEQLGIEANTGWDTIKDNVTTHHEGLIEKGLEPLVAVYVKDALAYVDYPIAYVNHGDETKRDIYKSLRDCLLSPEGQAEMLRLGRRALDINTTIANADPNVFNKDWGVNLNINVPSARTPSRDVLTAILNLIRTDLKRPSFTVYCLDMSGSMQGSRLERLKKAMEGLLLQDLAKQNFLQRGPDDITAILLFDDEVTNDLTIQDPNNPNLWTTNKDLENYWVVNGNNPNDFVALNQNVQNSFTDGNTAMYSCAISAYRYILTRGFAGYNPSVVILTDGITNSGATKEDLESFLIQNGILGEIPGYGIGFDLGEEGEAQLKNVANLTGGKVYKATDANLNSEMRKATGNN